jgi:lysophospholipase L1-like esterase
MVMGHRLGRYPRAHYRSTQRKPQHWGLVAFGALLAACGDASSAPSPFGAAPSAPDMPAGAKPSDTAPSEATDDSPSNSAPTDDGTDGAAMSGESVDPDLGLAAGTDTSSGASSGTQGQEPTPDDGTSAPPPSDSPAEPEREPEPEPEPEGPLTLYLAGDSIVQTYADTPSDTDQAGWGQMLGEFFDAELTIDNRAIGGRTARRFIDEGRLDEIVVSLEPGDYLLVQFGTNDSNRTATYTLGDATIPYFLDPATDFRAYLQRYIDAARSREANPLFVTPTPRNSAYCTGGNGTGAHAAAMSALGQEQGVPWWI